MLLINILGWNVILMFLRFTCSIMCTQHAADLNVIWLCVCVQAGAAAWESSVCVGAEHYGGLHHAREMPLRTHALPAGLSSAPPKNLRKQKRLRFPRSAAAQVASVVGSRGDTSRLPKTSLPLSLSIPPTPGPSPPPPSQTATGLPPATQKPAPISLF